MDYRVTDFLTQDELLAMLAEEASELTQAALKLRRVLDNRNPTPTGYLAAVKNLNEEIADVRLCVEQISCIDEDVIHEIRGKKLARWLTRLIDARRKQDDQSARWD
jgi:NTP pyrophosphatase (non-canonical NTP hydrolase)